MGALARLTDVEVRYGNRTVLALPSFEVRAGERVGLLGPSGAGKTTLLGLLAGIGERAGGDVEVLGIDPGRASDRRGRAARARIGYLAQSLDLVGPLSVRNNVALGRVGRRSAMGTILDLIRARADAEIDGVLDAVGLGGYERRRTDTLSGGEQQRVAIARVLHQQPGIMMADEPVASLDPVRADDVLGLLDLAAGDGPLVISLHDPERARAAAPASSGSARGGSSSTGRS